ncbi:hypothetical protein Pint_00130 [Pistacia integerrima]|uniref:Uncharacterized protein n=1 Tax=Pistacia integerrima TaxID=434235 RepID=A0ACC0ZLK6_9ROSI|nr:hypothetical protein Pint_00130 [Pistacia integerrima]
MTSGKESTASEGRQKIKTDQEQILAVTRTNKDCEKLETSEKKSRVSSRGKQNKKKRIADVENQTLAAPGGNSGGKEKRKFCISLTEEEIEADNGNGWIKAATKDQEGTKECAESSGQSFSSFNYWERK